MICNYECIIFRYGIDLNINSNGNGDTGSFSCKMSGSYVGNSNVSYIISSEFGRSIVNNQDLLRVSAQNKIAMFQTYAGTNDSSSMAWGILKDRGLLYYSYFSMNLSVIAKWYSFLREWLQRVIFALEGTWILLQNKNESFLLFKSFFSIWDNY